MTHFVINLVVLKMSTKIHAIEHRICNSYSLYSAKFKWEVHNSNGHHAIPEHILITTDRVLRIMDDLTYDVLHSHACKDTNTCIHVSETIFRTKYSFKHTFIGPDNNTYTIVFTRIDIEQE